MSGSGDDNLVPGLAQDPQACLQRQNERLQLLLNLTSRITSNLDLREVLRAISANFREVMRCDGAGIWLPGEEAGTFKLYAFDAPVSKGFAKEEVIVTVPEDDPARRAFETMKPMVRSEEHTSELQSRFDLVCRLLLEKKKQHRRRLTPREESNRH